MAGKFILPEARFRPGTAVQDKADVRDENVYSAVVLTHGAAGNVKCFTIPQGQTIPQLKGSAITATTNAHQTTYSEATTNLNKAGEFGSGLGDASVRAIGVSIEQAYYDGSGALNTYGAGQQEKAEILAKCSFVLKVGGKDQIRGPMFMFPSAGGMQGSIGTTESGVTVAVVNNGLPGNLRRLKLPILIDRSDTVEGICTVAGSASLTFSVTSGAGQPCLVWFNLLSLVKGDVR